MNIKRTSDKVRNPENTATESELTVMHEYKMEMEAGHILSPKIVTHNNKKVFYAPIIVNDLCLKCHGQKDDIPMYDEIAKLYQDDLTTGYVAGDLRGIWSVTYRE